MARVYVSAVVDVPIGKVWSAVRDFNALPAWHPMIEQSLIEDDLPGTTVDCVRRIEIKDGTEPIRERLLAFSELDRSYSYSILESPLALRNYVATIRFTEITDPESTLGEWESTFDVPQELESETLALVATIYREGLQNLTKILK